MKAYKYNRFSQGPRFSMQSLSVDESIIFIPELKKIIYNGYDGMGMKHYFGVCKEAEETKFIKEAEDYIADVKSGTLKGYSEQGERGRPCFHVKTISLTDKKETPPLPGTISVAYRESELVLSDYQEIELDITLEDIQKIISNKQTIEELETSTVELKKKFFK